MDRPLSRYRVKTGQSVTRAQSRRHQGKFERLSVQGWRIQTSQAHSNNLGKTLSVKILPESLQTVGGIPDLEV